MERKQLFISCMRTDRSDARQSIIMMFALRGTADLDLNRRFLNRLFTTALEKESDSIYLRRSDIIMSSMRFPSREEVEKVRNEYPKGCRVVLERMDDMQAPPIGTEGTVRGVDDTGSIMVKWDNGAVFM